MSGLFAEYTAPSVILTAEKEEIDYQFKVRQLNADLDDFTDFNPGDVEKVILNAEGGTTNAYAIATIENGNKTNDITFITLITTGEFLEKDDSTIGSGWYPTIEDMSYSFNITATEERPVLINYTEGIAGNFTAASTGTYDAYFRRGRHLAGTEIARFKLKYKADDKLIAGSYISTTTVEIST
jgi:hypothetical protein